MTAKLGLKPNSRENSHSRVWWVLKNLCGLGLIASLVFSITFSWPSLFNLPVSVGQFLVLLGGVSSLFHYVLLKRKNPRLQEPSSLLRQGGLFGLVRHPMYASDMVMFSGLWLMTSPVYSLPILIVAYVAVVKQAYIEDHTIARAFPEEYADWFKTTGLLLPRLK